MRRAKEGCRITKAEREIMDVIWEYPDAVLTKDVLDRMNEKGKSWKRQTLNTLLFRLEEKGVVIRKRAYVQAALTKRELLQRQTQEILNDMYEGKIGNFCAALIGNSRLTDEEADRLDALIDEWRSE